MISINFRDIIQTYEDSKDTILMSETETYPINDNEMNNWICELEDSYERLKELAIKFHDDNASSLSKEDQKRYLDDNSTVEMYRRLYNKLPSTLNFIYKNRDDGHNYFKEFGEIIKNHIRHVSFTDMMKVIEKVSIEMAEKINNIEDNKYDKIIFIVDNIAKKSNTWIFLLFIKYLKCNINEDRYDDILFSNNINNYFDVPQDQYVEDINRISIDSVITKLNDDYNIDNSKILCIYFDDMSYSGNQIKDNIYNFNNDNDNIDYYLGVAYISNSAIQLITEKFGNKIKLFDSTERIMNLGTVISDKEKLTLLVIRLYFNYFFMISENDIMENIPFIYFDHKIADNLSIIIQNILFLKIIPYKNFDENYNFISLFNNCGNIQFNNDDYKKLIRRTNIIDLPKELKKKGYNSNYICPKTFYKKDSIVYKFNNQEINKNYFLFREIERIKNETETGTETESPETNNKYYKRYIKYKYKYLNLKNNI